MSFDPVRGTYYRMPVFFGPTPGPRQWPKDEGFDPADQTILAASVSFLTRAEQLQPFLPDRFELWGEPVATLDITWMDKIPWLAGRGYAMSDFKFPAIYRSNDGRELFYINVRETARDLLQKLAVERNSAPDPGTGCARNHRRSPGPTLKPIASKSHVSGVVPNWRSRSFWMRPTALTGNSSTSST